MLGVLCRPSISQNFTDNDVWKKNTVASESIFIAPNVIGQIDSDSHHIAYDNKQAWLCSEPKPAEFLNSTELINKLSFLLSVDLRPLREKIPEFVEQIHDAQQRAAARIQEKIGEYGGSLDDRDFVRQVLSAPAIPSRSSRVLSEPERQLREISDLAARVFDTQIVIVQPRPDC